MYTWPNTNANNWPNTNTWSNTDTWPNTNTWPSPNTNTWPNTKANTWPNTKAISSACNAPLQIGQGEFEARCVVKTLFQFHHFLSIFLFVLFSYASSSTLYPCQ